MKASIRTTILVASIGLAGCASAGGGGGGGGNRDLLTTVDLREIEDQVSDAYGAVRRLRSTWLRSRASSLPSTAPTTDRPTGAERPLPVIFVDGTRYGPVDSLRSLRVSDIEEMEYLNASDATTQYGTGYPGGAILVTTR